MTHTLVAMVEDRSACRARFLRHPARTTANRVLRTWDRRRRARRMRQERSLVDRFDAAMSWLRTHTHSQGGVTLGHTIGVPYPEVTGYLIPSLVAWGERPSAARMALWLADVQNEDGVMVGSVGHRSLHVRQRPGGARPARGCGQDAGAGAGIAARCRVADGPGAGQRRDRDTGHGPLECHRRGCVPPQIHLYMIAPLADAGRLLGEDRYGRAAARVVGYYLGDGNPADVDSLSHFHAYIVSALLELGEGEAGAGGDARGRLPTTR